MRRFDRHALTVGAEYRNNLRQNQQAVDQSGLLFDDRRGSQTIGVYAEDEFRISEQVLLNAGIRFDEYFAAFGSTVNPRLAVIVSPVETTTVKVLYGKAFRATNPYELYYDQTGLSAGLDPERISTREVVAEQRIGARLQVTASLFHNSGRPDHAGECRRAADRRALTTRTSKAWRRRAPSSKRRPNGPDACVPAWPTPWNRRGTRGANRRISNSPEHVATLVLDAPVGRTGLLGALNGAHR